MKKNIESWPLNTEMCLHLLKDRRSLRIFSGISSVYSELIKQLGLIIRHNSRASDVAARLGGDEFVLLAPDTTSMEAVEVAERLRSQVDAYRLQIDGWQVGISISIGVASYPDNASDVEGLLAKADEAMYIAKKAGKNKTHLATTHPSPHGASARPRSRGGKSAGCSKSQGKFP